MKKKILIPIVAIIVLVSLVPTTTHLKDGGTVEYKSILYKISKVHSLKPIELEQDGKMYNAGIIVEVLGFEIYNNVK